MYHSTDKNKRYQQVKSLFVITRNSDKQKYVLNEGKHTNIPFSFCSKII